MLLVEPAWARKECSLLSSTKYNTCGQITVSAQWAMPGWTGSAASQKLLDARRGLGANLKASVQCWQRSTSRAFSQCLYLDKPPPAGWVKESWQSHSSPWVNSPNPGAQLTLTDVLISLGPCTKFDRDISAWWAMYQARHQQPIGNPWPLVLSLMCLVALGDTLTEKSEVMAPSGMLYVHPQSRRAAAWHRPASSFREKNRASTISFAWYPGYLYHTLEEFRDLLSFSCLYYYTYYIYYDIKRKLDNLVCM